MAVIGQIGRVSCGNVSLPGQHAFLCVEEKGIPCVIRKTRNGGVKAQGRRYAGPAMHLCEPFDDIEDRIPGIFNEITGFSLHRSVEQRLLQIFPFINYFIGRPYGHDRYLQNKYGNQQQNTERSFLFHNIQPPFRRRQPAVHLLQTFPVLPRRCVITHFLLRYIH